MRFIWLSLSIVAPLIAVNFISKETNEAISLTYLVVIALSEIVLLSLTISEFVKKQKENEYLIYQQIKEDRDVDISKWRAEFMEDSLNLYDMQKESLKRAKNINNNDIKDENKVDDIL